MRNMILKGFPQEVDYITERPNSFRSASRQRSGATGIRSMSSAPHGELQPLVSLNALASLDDLAAKLTGRGIPDRVLALGNSALRTISISRGCRRVTSWSPTKTRCPTYLPGGADINAVSNDEFAAGTRMVQQKPVSACSGFRRAAGLDAPFTLRAFLYAS